MGCLCLLKSFVWRQRSRPGTCESLGPPTGLFLLRVSSSTISSYIRDQFHFTMRVRQVEGGVRDGNRRSKRDLNGPLQTWIRADPQTWRPPYSEIGGLFIVGRWPIDLWSGEMRKRCKKKWIQRESYLSVLEPALWHPNRWHTILREARSTQSEPSRQCA